MAHPQTGKRPPPEPVQNATTRTLVIASFLAVALLLGLPVWWWTTSIYRAHLPLQEMLDWANGKVCNPKFPLNIIIDAPSIEIDSISHLVLATQQVLNGSNGFTAHSLELNIRRSSGDSERRESDRHAAALPALTVKLIPQRHVSSIITQLQPHSSTLEVSYDPENLKLDTSRGSIATAIASKVQELFLEEQAYIAYVLATNGKSDSINPVLMQSNQAYGSSDTDQVLQLLTPEVVSKLGQRAARSLRYASTYHLTFSLFTPSNVPSSWDIEDAVKEQIEPFLRSFSMSNFTINTQVQLFAAFSPSFPKPEYIQESNLWTIKSEDLSAFINAAEWPLGPSIGDGPTINFALYVPDKNISPLVVKENHASNWLIPQWGGVMILNKNPDSMSASLSKTDIRPAMLTFSHQLLSLLGVPETPPSLALKLESLTRIQTASLIMSASSTMGSLARLTSRLPGIPIPRSVALAVDTVLSDLANACKELKEGNFDLAHEYARNAEAEAEKAFFEKSMVGQVYFPDEHKVAVYLPLLGPVGVPLLMSLVKEIKKYASKRVQ